MDINPLIMVAVSEDPSCRRALALGVALAEATEGLLVPVHVRPAARALGAHEYVMPLLEALQEAGVETAAGHVRVMAGPTAALRMMTICGSYSAGLATVARDLRADLLVVAHDRSRRAGRRALRVLLRRCPAPVLALPAAGRPGRRGADAGSELDREFARLTGHAAGRWTIPRRRQP